MKKEERRKKKVISKLVIGATLCLGLILGIVPGNNFFGAVLKAKAAEPVSISGLMLRSVSGGVSACCTFTGFDPGSGYTMQLYLEKINTDGSATAIIYREVSPTADGIGQEETAPSEVETGVYRAVLMMKTAEGSDAPVVQFENSPLYDVVKKEDTYEVTMRSDAGEEGDSAGKGSGAESNKRTGNETEGTWCNHECGLNYSLCQKATPKEDAILAGECERCGEILAYDIIPNSAYTAFLEEAALLILEAKPGEQILIKTDRWGSFNRSVLDALSARRDVSVQIEYLYKGKEYVLFIPAGADTKDLADENGFCGFRYLDKIFGEGQTDLKG